MAAEKKFDKMNESGEEDAVTILNSLLELDELDDDEDTSEVVTNRKNGTKELDNMMDSIEKVMILKSLHCDETGNYENSVSEIAKSPKEDASIVQSATLENSGNDKSEKPDNQENEDPMTILSAFMNAGEADSDDEHSNSFEQALLRSSKENKSKVLGLGENLKRNALKENDKQLSEKETSVHVGDTDSSDDEDNKYCFESRYSESGKTLKKLLTAKMEGSSTSPGFANQFRSTWKKNNTTSTTSSPAVSGVKLESSVCADAVFGIRLCNPLISSTLLKEKMIGRESIPLARLKRHVANGNVSSDWVVAGVIVHKSSMKTSQKGAQYFIWKLSDLKGDLKTFSLFLFRNAAKELWKTSEGSAVAVLNPSIFDNRDGSGDEACLSVDNAQKVLVMGISKDLGICKARKKNGDACTSFVNKNVCEFCVYHLKQEYSKCARRSELMPLTPRGGLVNMRNKVLGKNEVFYAGKSFSAIPAKPNLKQREKDDHRLRSLSRSSPSSLSQSRFGTKLQTSVLPDPKKSLAPIEKDNMRLKILQGSDTNSSNKKDQRILEVESPREMSQSTALPVPKLGSIPKLSGNSDMRIDLNVPVSKFQREQAMMNAKKWIKVNGPLKKTDPNSIKKDESAKKRKFEETCDASGSSVNKEIPSPAAKFVVRSDVQKSSPPSSMFLLRSEAHKASQTTKDVLKSAKFIELMNAKSRHTDLLEANEERAQEEYFDKLEKKERLELKMLETFKISCKAVRCLKCKYTALSASDLCKNEKHPLKILDAMKRFFKCGNCTNRTVTLDLIPLHSCRNCGSSSWVRAPMIREKRTNLHVQPLSIRGDEEASLGNVANEGNLNLLVPDMDSGK